ncbi:MAG TPA: hypothetical protein PKA28_02905 [Methylomusa anaerophila]|uniref:Uncharacterized protein n=1 Tax=Methylomusa anaerophila TaxID=1930071 RepID=A0A348ANX2_9FIRM|nr:hypothetical protein [Methylomusa anaerophila]BBB92770.1 hypothetical protein MAMMFC1_03471 [Methylomusa anaerophila]HML87379.1 hypothetical protein [Methylomusa anaerophila]
MFNRLMAHDAAIVARGLLLLLLIIFIGVGVAEHQLAGLTQKSEGSMFFHIGRSKEYRYSVYLFGQGAQLKCLYQVGTISNAGRDLFIKIADKYFVVPTQVEYDMGNFYYWANLWRRQFSDEACKTKQSIQQHMLIVKPIIEKNCDKAVKQAKYYYQKVLDFSGI